jgi:hypothetical protein
VASWATVCYPLNVHILSRYLVTLYGVWTGNWIYWTLIQLVSTFYISLLHTRTLVSTITSSLAVAWWRLPTADVLLRLASRNVPVPQLPASQSNSSHGLNRRSPLTHWLTNRLFTDGRNSVTVAFVGFTLLALSKYATICMAYTRMRIYKHGAAHDILSWLLGSDGDKYEYFCFCYLWHGVVRWIVKKFGGGGGICVLSVYCRSMKAAGSSEKY